jgi:hypothetical protein
MSSLARNRRFESVSLQRGVRSRSGRLDHQATVGRKQTRTARAFGAENTRSAIGWPIRRPIANSEVDWSTGFAKRITNESSAGTVEGENGSDLIPGVSGAATGSRPAGPLGALVPTP